LKERNSLREQGPQSMVKGVVCRTDGADTTLLRCRAENSDESSVWVAKKASVAQNEIVEVLRTNASSEVGFTFVRTGKNIEGFIKSEYIQIMKCSIQRSDQADSTMLRCRPEDSQKNGVWVKGKICVAPDEEIEVVRVNSAGEAGWALIRTHENVEGYLRAAYVGSPLDGATIQGVDNQKNIASINGESGNVDESKPISRRTSSRVAAAPPSSTLLNFFSKTQTKSKCNDGSPPTPSENALTIKQNEEEAIRRSSRVRAPTKFLVKEMNSPSLDKWLQKGESKPDEESENGEDAACDAIVRDVVVDEERPLGDYLMKLRTCVLTSDHSLLHGWHLINCF
jgi:hypothetical protein